MSKTFLLLSILFFMNTSNFVIFDFNSNANISQWRVVDDVVMGGRSEGDFKVNKEGNGEFYGHVSTDNNGGFSSLRYRFSSIAIKDFQKIVIKLKGDGKKYQFRVKDNVSNYHSFISTFNTNGSWQTITITLSDMYPAFRGRNLNMGNLSSETIEEVAFLIGNKKKEHFKLEIDTIYLE
jgi:NADH dehydrogenase [ubiquinone] 1 alpha subcomplex assembly factor 1